MLSARVLLLPLLLHLSCDPAESSNVASAAEPASVARSGVAPRVVVPASLVEPALPLSDAARVALRRQDWAAADKALAGMDASKLHGAEQVDLAFLRAWAMLHAGRAAEAGKLLSFFDQGGTAPVPYRRLVRGEALRARGELVAALAELDDIEADALIAPRAAVQRAEVLHELGRTAEASALYESMIGAADPIEGGALALWALAQRHGLGSPEAKPLLLRLWTNYAGSSQARDAETALKRYRGWAPGDAEVVKRAERWMALSSYEVALTELAPVWERVIAGADLSAMCAARFVQGRSHYKRNRLSEAASALRGAGERCVGVPGEYGHRALFLLGQAEYRRGQFAASAAAYTAITRKYPETSFADDGLLHAGISLFEAGDLEGAKALWREALDRFPNGDTAPESTWRLAFALYESGEPAAAREMALRLAALDPSLDRVHVRAGAYWAARWALYPDVKAPQRALPSVTAHERAVAEWRALIEQDARDSYALLAWSRLKEIAPDVAAALAARPPDPAPAEGWDVRASFFASQGVGYGVALARLGLLREAAAEWVAAEVSEQAEPAEMAWLVALRYAVGDGAAAHKTMHWWLRPKPLWTIATQQDAVVRLAYPDTWWAEIQAASAPYAYPARLQHALVREESSFDPEAVSFAGARGLAQLMPGTAKETAGWLKRTVEVDDLSDPVLNLELGARYLHSVYLTVKKNPYLTLAGYNAGPHRVTQWREAWSDPPVDEFIERIPFRETRDYVKKVTSTWQVYSYSYDGASAPFPDLSAFNHHVSGE
jgi:soluble lytic murein transglycosylase